MHPAPDKRIKPWRDPPARDPDKAAVHLRRRLRRVSRRFEWRLRGRRLGRRIGLLVLGTVAAASLAWMLLHTLSPWPPLETLRHFAALPHCAAARGVGLAPARRNQPGYWAWHDADGNGVSCETRIRPAEPGVYHVR